MGHPYDCECYTPQEHERLGHPSPARDGELDANSPVGNPASGLPNDAETAIAGLLAEHTLGMSRCRCGYDTPWFSYAGVDALKARHRAHVASVIAAHMAAADELTALPEMVRLETAEKYREQRDALRERIRALGDEWQGWGNLPRTPADRKGRQVYGNGSLDAYANCSRALHELLEGAS